MTLGNKSTRNESTCSKSHGCLETSSSSTMWTLDSDDDLDVVAWAASEGHRVSLDKVENSDEH